MLRNDYRRSLIMLRPHVRGMSGHVRLERRTLAGSMRFTVQGAPSGVLHAILMANVSGNWVIYRLGALKNDSRGQSGMTASFDPRNLRGIDLDKYALIALVRTDADENEVAMTGMVNGYKDVNWSDVFSAATDEFAKPRQTETTTESVYVKPEAALEAADDAALARIAGDNCELQTLEIEAEPEAYECCCDEPEPASEASVSNDETDAASAGQTDSALTDSQASEIETVVSQEPEDGQADASDEIQEIIAETEAAPADLDEPRSERKLACELLNLDPDAEWPEDVEAVRELFGRAQASDSFSLDDFVFVDAPLPGDDGTTGVCAIGLRAKGGKPVSVCYALPGAYSLEPPPGLEDYSYLGGWWYTVLELI